MGVACVSDGRPSVTREGEAATTHRKGRESLVAWVVHRGGDRARYCTRGADRSLNGPKRYSVAFQYRRAGVDPALHEHRHVRYRCHYLFNAFAQVDRVRYAAGSFDGVSLGSIPSAAACPPSG